MNEIYMRKQHCQWLKPHRVAGLNDVCALKESVCSLTACGEMLVLVWGIVSLFKESLDRVATAFQLLLQVRE